MKKTILFTLSIAASLLFTSCWISPDYKDYEINEGVFLFRDYDTMKSVIIPKINASFTAWHWSSNAFDEKYEQYKGNITRNSADMTKMSGTDYIYAVRNEQSKNKVQTKDGQTIASEYFWITSKYEDSVIFYQN